MKFSFYIAWRYLFARKSRNIINVISAISGITVAIVTMALIIVLSAFNGLEKLVIDIFDVLDPDLKVEAASGKSFAVSPEQMEHILALPGVQSLAPVIEESALFVHGTRQHIGFIKGIDNRYLAQTPLDSMLKDGDVYLGDSYAPFVLAGSGCISQLGVNIYNPYREIHIYLPKRGKIDPLQPFLSRTVIPVGVLEMRQDYNDGCIFVPLELAEELTGYQGKVTSLEIKTQSDITGTGKERQMKAAIRSIIGSDLNISNRFEQHALMYKIMKSEKLMVFLIVLLIVIIATFNIVASLTMLIVDKKKDIMVLWSLGARSAKIRMVYLLEGILISVMGSLAGLVLGITVVWLQLYTSAIRLSDEEGAPPYPVDIQWQDVILVFFTVVAIGGLCSLLRVAGMRWDDDQSRALLG